MPNRKNYPSRGNRKLQLRAANSNIEGNEISLDESSDVRELEEIFPGVDREILEAVLSECEGDVPEATAKLFDILVEESDTGTRGGESIDLAVIACSLLSEENSTKTETRSVVEAADMTYNMSGFSSDQTIPHVSSEWSAVPSAPQNNLLSSASSSSEPKLTDFLKGSGKNTQRLEKNMDNSVQSGLDRVENGQAKFVSPLHEQSRNMSNNDTQSGVANKLSVKPGMDNVSDVLKSLGIASGLAQYDNEQSLQSQASHDILTENHRKKISNNEASVLNLNRVTKQTEQPKFGLNSFEDDFMGLKGQVHDPWDDFYAQIDEALSQPISSEDHLSDSTLRNPIGLSEPVSHTQTKKSDNLPDCMMNNLPTENSAQFQRQNSASSQSDRSVSSTSTDHSGDRKSEGFLLNSKLSPSASEFVPRSLTKRQPMPTGQNKTLVTAPAPLQPLAGVPRQKLKTRTGGKKKDKVSDLSQPPVSQPSDPVTWSEANSIFDPMDPLGWNTLFLDPSVTDPKPQRQQRTKEMPPNQLRQRSKLSADLSPALNNKKPAVAPFPKIKKGTSKRNEMDTSASSFGSVPTTDMSDMLSSLSVESRKGWLRSSSEWSSITRPNPADLGNKVGTRTDSIFPPSLFPTKLKADVANRSTSAAHMAHVTSVPKDMHNRQTPPPVRTHSSPSLASKELSTKNKLSFLRVTSPVGIVRHYVQQKQPVMVILRGLPGSGKSWLARQLMGVCKEMGVAGVVLSTDKYFTQQGSYQFDRNLLSTAHDWNKQRALRYAKDKVSPIIIDNTNTELCELLPYAIVALDYKYDVQVFEPDTAWKTKVGELTKRNSHSVTHETIKRMKGRYQRITTEDVLKAASKTIAERYPTTVKPSEKAKPAVTQAPETVLINKKSTSSAQETGIPRPQLLGGKEVKEMWSGQDSHSETPPATVDLGLGDWVAAEPAPQRVVSKQKKKKKTIPSEADKAKPAEISKDFLNQSLKKAMVNIMNLGVSQARQAQESEMSSQNPNADNTTAFSQGVRHSVIPKEQVATSDARNDVFHKEFIFGDDDPVTDLKQGSSSNELPQIVTAEESRVKALNNETSSVCSEEAASIDGSTKFSTGSLRSLQTEEEEEDGEESVRNLNSSVCTTDSYKSCFSDFNEMRRQDEVGSELDKELSPLNDRIRDLAGESTGTEMLSLQAHGTAGELDEDGEELETPATVIEHPGFTQTNQTSLTQKEEVELEPEKPLSSVKDNTPDMEMLKKLDRSLQILGSDERESDGESDELLQGSDDVVEIGAEVSIFGSSRITQPGEVVDKSNLDKSEAQTDNSSTQGPEISKSSCLPPLVDYSDSGDSDPEFVLAGEGHVTGDTHSESEGDENIGKLSNKQTQILSTPLGPVSRSKEGEGNNDDRADNTNNRTENVVIETSEDKATNSNDSPTQSSREQSPDPATVTEQGSPTTKSRKKKRIKPGRNPGPFIDESVKEISKTTDWNSFLDQLPDKTSEEIVIPSVEETRPPSQKVSTSTQSDSYYFSIVYKLNSVSFNDLQPLDLSLSDEGVIQSSPCSLMMERWGNSSPSEWSPIIKTKGTIDRSTFTDEALEREEIDMETLHNCFPEYSRKHLDDIMSVCHNDLEWVSAHLLESPAVFDMEDDEDARSQGSGNSNGHLSVSSVKPLADICRSYITRTNSVDEDELEMQEIRVGEDRLQKIERFGKARLLSVEEKTWDQNYWPDDFDLDGFTPPVSPASSKPSELNLKKDKTRMKDKESSGDSNFLSNLFLEKNFQLPSPSSGILSQYVLDDSSEESASEQARSVGQTLSQQVVVPAEFVRCLESLYGPLNLSLSTGGLYLDDHIARKIHNCLKLQTNKKIIRTPENLQLEQDEAYARQLQDEEDAQRAQTMQSGGPTPFTVRQSNVPGWTNQKPSWMSTGGARDTGITNETAEVQRAPMLDDGDSPPAGSVSQTLHRLRGHRGGKVKPFQYQCWMPKPSTHSVWSGGKKKGATDSLLSIMEEEKMRERRLREEFERLHRSGADALATKIKRQQLAEMFPTLQSDVLEEVYRDNGYNMENTILTLENTYNLQRVSVSKEKEQEILRDAQQFSRMEYNQSLAEANAEEDFYYTEGTELSYEALRNEAQFYRGLARDCQEKAQAYHVKGMHVAAFVYRQKAKTYKDEEYNANHRAADVLFEKGLERLEKENTLDLHLYHLDEAIKAVNQAIEQKEELYLRKPDRKNSYLNIVTGWGKNSRGGIPRLKPAIMSHLRDKCYKFEEKIGMLRVYLGQRG